MTPEQHAGSEAASTPVDEPTRRRVLARSKLVLIIAGVALALGAGRTVLSRMATSQELQERAATQAKQYVKVTQPKAGAAGQSLVLPGTLQGQVQSPVAARASGYLRRWTRDIGSQVKKGELLAEIDTPEIDQQLTQAIAAREQTASSLALAKSTVERWEALRKKDAVSQQDLDERRSAFAQARANLAAADANVERLRQLESFKRIVAPFAGVITRRNVDVGDLIDAGGGSGRSLFVLTQTDPLRIYINVPQSYAQMIKPGQAVTVTQPELPGQTFRGEVARTAGAIDAASRTLQIEVSLPNRDNVLLPGAYVQVALPLQAGASLTVSTNALLFRSAGPQVAVVNFSGRVHLRAVRLGRNFGQSVEILEGVNAGDRLVLNPSDALRDGDAVEIAADAPAGNASGNPKAAS
ncbi:RND family efflux transporter, MFP subunit [Noviherbaspirillum humi]|uniref:RND family efflux transporter, MFP subunit n=1 Tax=Noviherbaspirillum humi TaxID=1688639 RepID=A0A239EZQ4_9BURK|nr:efflux RND transporter periplasmic adaptor subunit [Noviherbaspirillum humi]SNS50075.1 RND family efflux transporter, MFP subunit [Noviherbaspirillum humi]